MIVRLLIASLLCASALADGVMVLGSKVQTKDVFTCLRQSYPDFVMIAMDLQTQNWDAFKQSHQNALDAGYKHVHVSIATWQPLQPGSLPVNFSGRVWITGVAWLKTYAQLVTQVEDLASQGYNAGIMGTPHVTDYLTGVVPSVISNLPYALEFSTNSWTPFAGWQCPSLILGAVANQCTQTITPLESNASCV